MMHKAMARLKGEMALALFRTFVARGIAALGSLLLVVVLGRLYGPEGVGAFALAQSVILGAALLARYGMDNALMRFVGQNARSRHTLTYLSWGLRKAGGLSIVAAVVIFLGRHTFEWLFGSQALSEVLIGIAIATPAFTLAFLLAGFMKGIGRPATACLLENGSISLAAAGVLLALHWAIPAVGVIAIGWAFAVAAWLVVLQGAWQLLAWQRGREQPWEDAECVSRQVFNRSSRAFFVLNLAEFLQTVVSIWIAGFLLTSSELGLFKSAQQMALLIMFILMVINAIFPPRFARLYHEGNHQGLARLARQGALLGTLLASPLLLVCLVVPQWVLGWMGDEFVQAAPLLRIIAVAQLVNVATGSVGFLLNMTGHEALMRNIALSANAIGIGLFMILIPLFDELGAALALASVLVLQNVIALLFVWRRLGIWMMPLPNLFRLAGIPTTHSPA